MNAGTINYLLEVKDKFSKTFEKLNGNLKNLNERAKKTKMSFTDMASKMLVAFAAFKVLAAPINAAIKFEEAMSDVKKVVDGTPEQFKAMSKEILNLSKVIPLSGNELAQIYASGGQLGIARENLKGFTTTVAKMATAFDMTPDVAGDAMAKLSNILKIPVDEIGSLGDMVNHISNNMAAKAPEMINVLLRAGAAAKGFGMTSESITALSGAMLSLGMPAEVAGTSISVMLARLKTIGMNKKGIKHFRAMGLSVKQMSTAMATGKGGEFLTKMLEKMKGLSSIKRTQVISDMFGIEQGKNIERMVNGLDSYKKAMGLLGKETNFTGSMQKEFEARSSTTANALKIMGNRLNVLMIGIGNMFLPVIRVGAKLIGGFADAIVWLNEKVPLLTGFLAFLTAGLIAYKVVLVATSLAMPAYGFALTTLGNLTKVWTAAQWLLNVALTANPIGLIIAGVAALGLAVAGMIIYWDEFLSVLKEIGEWFSSSWAGQAWDYVFGSSEDKAEGKKTSSKMTGDIKVSASSGSKVESASFSGENMGMNAAVAQ